MKKPLESQIDSGAAYATPADAAKRLRCDDRRVIQMAKRGEIRGIQHGRTWVFHMPTVIAHLNRKAL
jgi:excisionase family DNA binding protein